jgi:hypothetical protein
VKTSRLSTCLACCALIAAAGCIYVVHERVHDSGKELTELDLLRVKPGTTTRDELVQWFGPPTTVTRKTDGTEELAYVLIRQVSIRKTIMVVYQSGSSHTTTDVWLFEVRDGVIQACKRG